MTKQPNISVDFSFLPEVGVTKLPSGFVPYPPGTQIKYRSYLFGEVKQASQSRWNNLERLTFMAKGITATIPVESLTIQDLVWIGLLRRLSSLGTDNFTATVVCQNEECQKEGKMRFSASDIEFEDLKLKDLPVIITWGKKVYEMKPATFKAFKEGFVAGKPTDPVELLARCCVNHPFEQTYQEFYAAQGEFAEALERVDEMMYHGIKDKEYLCPHCGTKTSVDLEGGDALIMPFRESNSTLPSCISIGKASEYAAVPPGAHGLHGGGDDVQGVREGQAAGG